MQRNSDSCTHCGRTFVRLDEASPTVNRAAATFHVNLFWGPNPHPDISDQFTCFFAYVRDDMGPERKFLVVYLLPAIAGQDELLRQSELAADRIAGLLLEGHNLEPAYTLRGDLLKPGGPD